MKYIIIIMALCFFSCKKENQPQQITTKPVEKCEVIKKSIQYNVINGTPIKIETFYYSGNRLDSILFQNTLSVYMIEYNYSESFFRKKTFRKISGPLPYGVGQYFHEQLDEKGNILIWTRETEKGEILEYVRNEFIIP